MSPRCNFIVNGRSARASFGETLIDAAVGAGVVIPQDCCSGQCGTCLVRVVSGEVNGHGTADRDTVLACQATVDGDVEISFEETPETVKRGGLVAEITSLSPQVIEVTLALQK